VPREIHRRPQAETAQKEILPKARESLRLVQLGYERGDPKYDFTALLQAQQTLAQVRLMYVEALGELWKAVSKLSGLLQQESLDCPPPPPPTRLEYHEAGK
jgi:outer membrane protein TolC